MCHLGYFWCRLCSAHVLTQKQIWVLLHMFSVKPHPPRGAGVVTLTAAVSPCMQELSSVPGYCQPTQKVSDKGVLNKGPGYRGSFPVPPEKVLPLWRAQEPTQGTEPQREADFVTECKSSHLKGRGQSLLQGCFKHHKKTPTKKQRTKVQL